MSSQQHTSADLIEKGLGRELAHSTEKGIRDAGIQKFYKLLKENGGEWREIDFLKCWKETGQKILTLLDVSYPGLYFCFWMSDKPLVQQELAENLASIIHSLPDSVALQYLNAFWSTLASEWHNLDRIRLNKYYHLIRRIHVHTFTWLSDNNWDLEKVEKVISVLQTGPLNHSSNKIPNSLRYHTIEVLFSQLADACESTGINVTTEAMSLLLAPFIEWLRESDSTPIVDHIFQDILDLYKISSGVEQQVYLVRFFSSQEMARLIYHIPSDSSARGKNKKMVQEYLKGWGEACGIPFTPSMTVTGLNVKKIDLKVDIPLPKVIDSMPADSLPSHSAPVVSGKKSKKRKSAPVTVEGSSPVKKIKDCEVVVVAYNANIVAEEEAASKELPAIQMNAISPSCDKVEQPIAVDAAPPKKKKNKKKKNKNSLADPEKMFKQLQDSTATEHLHSVNTAAVEEEETLVQEDAAKPASKSVTWGPKKIKPFKKNSIICSNEEAQKVPDPKSEAPKVLKAFEKQKILMHTLGSRKSKRRN